MNPRTELTLMIRPSPCSRMWGSTARVIRIEPKRLVSNKARACSIELSSAAPETPTPALLTRTSMRPDRWSTSRTAPATESSSVTSSGRNTTPPCFSPGAALRLVPYTVNPAPTSALAAASPIPADAPVTTATRPVPIAMSDSFFSFILRPYYHSTDVIYRTDRIDARPAREVRYALPQGPKAGHQTTHPRSSRAPLQTGRHRRRRRGDRDVRRRPDQRRLLQPLHVEGGPRRQRSRRPAARPTAELRRPARSRGTRGVHPLLPVSATPRPMRRGLPVGGTARRDRPPPLRHQTGLHRRTDARHRRHRNTP